MFNKKNLLITILALIILVFGACSEEVELEPVLSFKEQERLGQSFITNYKQYLTTSSPQEARLLIVNELRDNEKIESAGISQDNTIWWIIKGGTWHVFLTQTNVDLANTENQEVPMSPAKNTKTDHQNLVLPHNRKALILAPLRFEWKDSDAAICIEERLSEACYVITPKYNMEENDNKIEINDYERFDEYGVIAISTHAMEIPPYGVCICTGIKIPNEEIEKKYKEHINPPAREIGYVWLVTKDKEDPLLYYGFTTEWMKNKYPNKLTRTLFYLSACNGFLEEDIANAIVGDESAFFGWDNTISTQESKKTSERLFTLLTLDALNCGEAYQRLKKEGLDTHYNNKVHLIFRGEPNLRLVGKCCGWEQDTFPPPPGESWEYKITASRSPKNVGYTYTFITEKVEELVGGYVVYRRRMTDRWPPNFGEYIGCDSEQGEVYVAGDRPHLFEKGEKHFYKPVIPLNPLPYDTNPGTVKETPPLYLGDRAEWEVISYETVTVPFGTFEKAQKIKITHYERDGTIENNVPPYYVWFHPEVRMMCIKEEGFGGSRDTSELIDYKQPTTQK